MKRSKKNKYVIYLSMILLVLSINLSVFQEVNIDKINNNIGIEFINTKNMAVSEKNYKNSINNPSKITDVPNPPISNNIVNMNNKIEETKNESIPNESIQNVVRPPVWSLPIKTGYITNYEYYNHVAIDITSYRGTNETIYPVYDGVISSMYFDIYGARIVTVKHNVNGIIYTSQYVHLSSYAPGLYVGKPVTVNDPLGQMGMTGIATGVHLHISVADCSLFEDNNCKDLGSFYRYLNRRYNEGFKGLRDLMYVPDRW